MRLKKKRSDILKYSGFKSKCCHLLRPKHPTAHLNFNAFSMVVPRKFTKTAPFVCSLTGATCAHTKAPTILWLARWLKAGLLKEQHSHPCPLAACLAVRASYLSPLEDETMKKHFLSVCLHWEEACERRSSRRAPHCSARLAEVRLASKTPPPPPQWRWVVRGWRRGSEMNGEG